MQRSSQQLTAVIAVFLLLAVLPAAIPAGVDTTKIQWLSYEEGLARAKEADKPVLVNFTASWCGWCKKMKKETFSDPAVIAYVNDHYLPVMVDTQKEQALAAMYAVRSVPMILFLTSEGQKLTLLPGYVEAPRLLNIISFIATESYKTMDYESYVQSQSVEG